MSIPDSLGFSHTRHIAKFSSKFYYRRLLEAIICLVVYKSVLIYCVHWLFSVDESPFFNILFEYVVSTFLVLNISIELYSHIDYKTSFVKYVLVNSGRMMLLFFDACSISNSYGMNRFNSHIGKTCLYFFPGKIMERIHYAFPLLIFLRVFRLHFNFESVPFLGVLQFY